MSDRTFIVRKGINTPNDRFEPGERIQESQLEKGSVKWLLDDGAIEEPTVEASPAAVELAAEEGIDLEEVEGSGAGGNVTKGDVAKAIKEREAANG